MSHTLIYRIVYLLLVKTKNSEAKKNDSSNWLDLSNIELMNSEKQLKSYCRVLKLISNVSSK